MTRKKTNEWEFQGDVLSWLNGFLKDRLGMGLDKVTQEKPQPDAKRNDLVVWRNRSSEDAFMTIELKTPKTSINDFKFFEDALSKAKNWNASYFLIWNMQQAMLYEKPIKEKNVTPGSKIKEWPLESNIKAVEDWLKPQNKQNLERRIIEILDFCWEHDITSISKKLQIDASIFVEKITYSLERLRKEIHSVISKKALKHREFRKKLRTIAAKQGFLGFVDDIDEAVAGQHGYRIIGQILFYFALRRQQPELRDIILDQEDIIPDSLESFWNDVRRYDYEALYSRSELDDLAPLSNRAQEIVRDLISQFRIYDWISLKEDVLGSVFEQLIPAEERHLLGQFYTPIKVADLITAFTIDGDQPCILDPGCGSGTFLMSAYRYMDNITQLNHKELLSTIWGIDLSPLATELAMINLYRQNLTEFNNFPRIVPGDFFNHLPGQKIEFPIEKRTSKGPQKAEVPIPKFDAIIGNPPYLRSQNQDDLDDMYKERLYKTMERLHTYIAPKTDLFAFFIYHSIQFLAPKGRLGFVTSASWLTAEYASTLQYLLLDRLKLIAVITSQEESFFSQVDINTTIIIAEMPDDKSFDDDIIRFVSLKKKVGDLVNSSSEYWKSLMELVGEIEAHNQHVETEKYRLYAGSIKEEKKHLIESPKKPRNWSKYLRAPISYYKMVEENTNNKWTELSNIANVSLGYKSLQNSFFYLDSQDIKNYKIEEKYLHPIFMLKDFNANKFLQTVKPKKWLFNCTEEVQNLKRTGALRYIQSMAEVTAGHKKQSGEPRTIRSSLEKQGGKLWYAPKARIKGANIWLRKAFNTNLAPFLFEKEMVVDQRCNKIIPKEEISWEELAAIMSSTVFAMIIEVNGASAMGAGALEAATEQLKRYPIPDLRSIDKNTRKDLVKKARLVWKNNKPVNWSDNPVIGKTQRELDEFILNILDNPISIETLYSDLSNMVKIRIDIAKSKPSVIRRSTDEDIYKVAKGIVEPLKTLLESRVFPVDFIEDKKATYEVINLESYNYINVNIGHLFGNYTLALTDEDGSEIAELDLPRNVADALLQALLIGQRKVTLPEDEEKVGDMLNRYFLWIDEIKLHIETGLLNSVFGTSYESKLRKAVMDLLEIHELAGERELPFSFSLKKPS